MLLGNHDYQYTPWDTIGCSDKEQQKASSYWKAIFQNIDLLQIAHMREVRGRKTIFSHGGVCQTYLDECGLEKPEEINTLWIEQPQSFLFKESSTYGKPSSLDGDDPWQSPLWVRDCALREDALPGYDQIVGHTPAKCGRTITHGENVIKFVCTLDKNNFLILDD